MAESSKNQYLNIPLEEVIGDRFGRYSKYIIQDRALPDVRDGLKPVQRRILYAMLAEGNTHDKNFRKAAKTVGTVIGNYHPHGDTSVYEAMVRMSQDWKMRNPLIEMHGNNGSVDGDPPAAMRYTEARLSIIASELLKDINKDTVEFIDNFDDTDVEPTVLPAKFPNLLVNGSTGISAGYATDIPPHNLGEVIDAVIMRIDKPKSTIDDLFTVFKGPDFPTGGILQGLDGLKKAYTTGKGRVILRGKAIIEKMRGEREQITIEEIPYDVNKANLVKRIDELRLDRKVEGILEVRDDTDRTGLRIVIELRKDANSEGILNYLYKNTDLQVAYNFNMVAIVDKTPQLLSLTSILDAYIMHQKEVVTRSTNFDLKKARARAHIVEGLIKAISILDELIVTIRASKDKQDAKKSIIEKYGFTEEQAEAIVTLQLYRLTNTDITLLQKEQEELENLIKSLELIVSSEKRLFQKIKKELLQLKKTYATDRLTVIEEKIEELKINIDVTVASEDVVASITNEGYIKRTSIRSYAASNGEDLAIKENDRVVGLYELNTTDKLLLFTNTGKYMQIPVHELPDIRWKDIGQHLSNITGLEQDERIIKVIPIRKMNKHDYVIFITKNGMIKKTKLELYDAQRHNRTFIAINLREDDEVVFVEQTNGKKDIFIASNKGYSLWYNEKIISPVGLRAAGVLAIQLKDDEFVVGAGTFSEDERPSLYLITQRGFHKRMRLQEFKQSERNKRGQIMLRHVKTKPHEVLQFYIVNEDSKYITIVNRNGENTLINVMEMTFSERTSNGSAAIEETELAVVYRQSQYTIPFPELN